MLKIRLMRFGRRNDPHFRVVVVPQRSKPDKSKYIESLGNYNPRAKAPALVAERIKYWMGRGALPSPTVHNMLVRAGIIPGPKIPKHSTAVVEKEATPTESAQVSDSEAGAQPATPNVTPIATQTEAVAQEEQKEENAAVA